MARTPLLDLPLLAAAQAQKHVTVNEALSLLDALTQLTALSRSQTSPPGAPAEGDRYLIPSGATGAWAGADHRIALRQNGGWLLLAPQPGWRLWIADETAGLVYDGAAWIADGAGGAASPTAPGPIETLAAGPNTAELRAEVLAFDEPIQPGWKFDASTAIPAGSVVLGLAVRVTSAITGAPTWRLGTDAASGRYGSGLSTAQGAEIIVPSGNSIGYATATPLVIGAESAQFTGGALRIAVHLFRITAPTA